VKKGDTPAPGAGPGKLVDQPKAKGAAALQRLVKVGDAEAEVMDARTASGEKSADRAVGSERLEKLDVDVAERERQDGGAVGLLGRLGRRPEYVAIKRERLGEVADGDADVGDAGMPHPCPLSLAGEGNGRALHGSRPRRKTGIQQKMVFIVVADT